MPTEFPTKEIVQQMWQEHGRHYFTRHDFENLPQDCAQEIVSDLRQDLSKLPGKSLQNSRIQTAGEFTYEDPIDHSIAEKQGIQIALEDRSRIVIRLSGTGTEGATLRFYFERFLRTSAQLDGDVQSTLSSLIQFAYRLTGIRERSGRKAPDVIT